MEFRRIFDTIPEQFDRYRTRYTSEMFEYLIQYAGIGPGKQVLELGPGTGQATEPILDTGCDYLAIELGENFAEKMIGKYGNRPNFKLICGDFITHDFAGQTFDLIYSAATIQWIPEEVAFSKTYSLLRPGGTLAMMRTLSDYRTPNEALYQKIQQVYDRHFKPAEEYTGWRFRYENAVNYGYTDFTHKEFYTTRELTAEQNAAYKGTDCSVLSIPEPDKTLFFEGILQAVREEGNRIVYQDTTVLQTVKKV